MPPANGQIAALVALISNASKVVEAHYARSSKPYIPSLDDVEPHPLDDTFNSELKTAIQIIEGASAQLCATIARPNQTIVNKFMEFFEPNCLNVAITFKIPDILLDKPKGMHISEIGQRTGIEQRKVGRILRLLATKHVFREVSENTFANNRLSVQLLSSNPLSSLGSTFTCECQKSSAVLSEVLADKEWGHSYAANHTSFNKYSGSPDTLFEYYEKDCPEIGARFAVGMIGWGGASEARTIIYDFPWKDLGDNASVCDVGGGIGATTLQLAKVYPTLKLVLQDLPARMHQARNEVWPKECPAAIVDNRIQFEPIDFLTEPPVSGCDVYYLKNVIQNWPDADCIKILSNIRSAMGSQSRVLIHEYILQPASRVSTFKESSFDQAPEPMLPNYGAGRIRQYNLDINMMVMLNSEERRLSDFIKLGEAAGLMFVKLWDFGEMGLVEYCLDPSV